MQPESPGPLGTHDSASPDNQRAAASTPGPLGTNDSTESGGMPEEEKIMLARLKDAWDTLESSRSEIFHIYQLGFLLPESDTDTRIGEEWEKHGKLALAYFALVKEYLRDYYDPKANWGTYLRIGLMLGDEVLRQHLGSEPSDESMDLTGELAILHCEKAFEHYQKTKDEESLFYVLTLAAELQAHGSEHYEGLSEAVLSLLKRLRDEHKPATLEQAWQRWLKTLITGIKPGDPLWLREIAKAVTRLESPSDPIKEHFQRTQMMERMGKE
jgi:hypothetical protein